jgi:hypothetical protein
LNDILATGKLISCLLRHMPYAYPPIIHVPSQQVNGRRRAYRIRRACRCGRAPRLVSTLSKCCCSCDLEELSRIRFSSWPHLLSLCVSAPEQASDVYKEGIELTLTRAEPQGWSTWKRGIGRGRSPPTEDGWMVSSSSPVMGPRLMSRVVRHLRWPRPVSLSPQHQVELFASRSLFALLLSRNLCWFVRKLIKCALYQQGVPRNRSLMKSFVPLQWRS